MTLAAINSKLVEIVREKTSYKPGIGFGERLDQIQENLRNIDLNGEFKQLGASAKEAVKTELKQVQDSSQINIIDGIADGASIEGGFLDIGPCHSLTVDKFWNN